MNLDSFYTFATQVSDLYTLQQKNDLVTEACFLSFGDLEKRNNNEEYKECLHFFSDKTNIQDIISTYNLDYQLFQDAIENIPTKGFINLNSNHYKSLGIYTGGKDISKHTNKYISIQMSQALIATREQVRMLFLEHEFTFLSISSAYRSPAYQLIILCKHIVNKQVSIEEAFQTVAPPFCSKHNLANPPIDLPIFMPKDSGPFMDFDAVYDSDIRKSFCNAAKKYNLIISYPKGTINNGLGEPREFILS